MLTVSTRYGQLNFDVEETCLRDNLRRSCFWDFGEKVGIGESTCRLIVILIGLGAR